MAPHSSEIRYTVRLATPRAAVRYTTASEGGPAEPCASYTVARTAYSDAACRPESSSAGVGPRQGATTPELDHGPPASRCSSWIVSDDEQFADTVTKTEVSVGEVVGGCSRGWPARSGVVAHEIGLLRLVQTLPWRTRLATRYSVPGIRSVRVIALLSVAEERKGTKEGPPSAS